MKRKPLNEVMQALISDRRRQIVKEIAEWDQKLHNTAYYYGYGGPYGRQEKAKEKAEQELEDLNRFDMQLVRSVELDNVHFYGWYCPDCGAVTLCTKPQDGPWHECGSCRHMINKARVADFNIEFNRACTFGALMRRLREEAEHDGVSDLRKAQEGMGVHPAQLGR